VIELSNIQAESENSPGSRFLKEFGQLRRIDPESAEGALIDECIPKLLELFINKIPLLFDKAGESDAEAAVQLVIHHLFTKLHSEESARLANLFAAAISAKVRNRSIFLFKRACAAWQQERTEVGMSSAPL